MREERAATLGCSLVIASRIFCSRAVIPSTNFPPPTLAAAALIESSVSWLMALDHESFWIAACILDFHLPAAAFICAVGERRGFATPASQSAEAFLTRLIIFVAHVLASTTAPSASMGTTVRSQEYSPS